MKVWLIIVEPAQGWGLPWYYIFKDGEKAVVKFEELVKQYNLEECGVTRAISLDGNNKRHIERIILQPEYTED